MLCSLITASWLVRNYERFELKQLAQCFSSQLYLKVVSSFLSGSIVVCALIYMFFWTDILILSIYDQWDNEAIAQGRPLKTHLQALQLARVPWMGMYGTLNMASSTQHGDSSSATLLAFLFTTSTCRLRPITHKGVLQLFCKPRRCKETRI